MQRLLFDFLFFSLGGTVGVISVFYRLADSLTEK